MGSLGKGMASWENQQLKPVLSRFERQRRLRYIAIRAAPAINNETNGGKTRHANSRFF